MRFAFAFILSPLTFLITAYHLDPSTLHPPGTPLARYSPSGSILYPSPPYRPWLIILCDGGRDSGHLNNHSNNRDIAQPTWYRPHPHASYHNTTYYLNQDASPQQFKPERNEYDDPKYIYAFLDDIEKEQERGFLMSQVDDLHSLPPVAKSCLAIAGILFAYLLMDALGGTVAEWWLGSAEARAERKKERGRRIRKRWWKRYSLVGALRRWNEMTMVQMGINPGGPNSLNPVKVEEIREMREVPMMSRSVETRRTETRRFEQYVPYTPQAMRQMQEETNRMPAHEEVAPSRSVFGGMPGSPLWFTNQARRAFRKG